MKKAPRDVDSEADCPSEQTEQRGPSSQPFVRPARVLRLLLMVAAMLAAVVVLLPSGHLQISDNLQFSFLSWDALLGRRKVEYADIRHIVQANQEEIEESQEEAEGDSKPLPTPAPQPPPRKDIDQLQQEKIENAQALAPFFAQLADPENRSKLIRVLHYGDSQVEGDRISDYIREQLQKELGGCGVGLLPVYDPIPSRVSVTQTVEGEWRQYVPYGKRDEDTPHDRYGILGQTERYGPVEKQSEEGDVEPADAAPKSPLYAVARVKKSRLAFPRARNFEILRLLSGNAPADVEYTIRTDGQMAAAGVLTPEVPFELQSWPMSGDFSEVEIEFASRQSPDLYGLALDCPEGIAVDNIPMRGASGVFMHRLDADAMADQIRRLNAGLIIWQFGVNVVPYLTDNFDFYRRQLQRSLQTLRRTLPDVPILVIGVSDMARKGAGDFFESYPNIEGVRNAQRQAALEAGCAFWDLFEAMGGKQSMPSWVLHEPSLATTDFTHFNYRGARIVSRMLYKALQKARQDWKAQAKEGN